jgi:predicted Zn-dependent protease
MKEAGGTGKKSSGNKSILFAGLGVVFLFLMAITSSIDISFVYVFTGVSTFFFFLAIREWLRNSRHEPGTGNYNRDPGRPGAVDPTPNEPVSEIYHRQPTPAAEPQKKQKKKELKQEIKGVADARSKFTLTGCVAAIIVLSFFGIIAIVLFTAVFEDDSNFDKLYYNDNGRSYYNSNQYDSAAKNYRRALKLDPDFEEAQVGYGKTLLYGFQQYDSAEILFNIVLENNSQHTEAQENRGSAYYYQKKYDLSLNDAFSLMERDSTNTQPMLIAGDCYFVQKDYDGAVKWYRKAYDLGERGENLAWNLAFIYDTKGNTKTAIKFYKETLEYDNSIEVVEIYRRLAELVPGDSGQYYRTREYQLRQQTK